MAPTTKDNDVLTAVPTTSAAAPESASFRPDETASRPQPVALEIPVSVNGARTVDGSDKREPFSESTKTVLVFGTGAVIRLSSPVAPGQLLFLTNDKTKKEVVCQVVKSKNYRSISGYVELEFTEPVVGFWGMRFPSDRVAAPVSSSAATIAAAKPSLVPPAPSKAAPPSLPPSSPTSGSSIFAASKSDAKASLLEPAAPQVKPQLSIPGPSAGIETQPAVPVSQAPLPPKAPVSPAPLPNSADTPLASPTSTGSSLASSFLSLISSPEIPAAVPPQKSILEPRPSSEFPSPAHETPRTSVEDLRQQTERLEAQLTALAFADAPGKKPVSASSDPKEDSQLASKFFDMASNETPSEATLPPAKVAPPPIKSSLDAEELKIPSWLEPLARNAAAPASTQELVEREKAKHAAELASRPAASPQPVPVTATEAAPGAVPAVELPGIGNLLPLDDDPIALTQSSGGSKKGFWLAVAAVIVAAVSAGGWYYFQNSQTASSSVAPVTRNVIPEKNATTPATSPVLPATQPAPQIVPPEAAPLSKASQPDVAPAPSTPSVKPAESSRPVPAVRDNSTNGAKTIPAASTERIPKSTAASDVLAAAPPQPEPKKPNIGEVHLASPMVNRPVKQADGIAAPTISEGDSAANLGAGLSEPSSGQPAAPEAPLPVGGDVRPAKLISSVSPAYPALAKTEHVAGDVKIDALIDATGKVTTMKVLSGPALLQRAAMYALRQWKYQPATLDGKPVPMHLTVTLQFRMP